MSKQFHYCYLITNIEENKFYIGVRSCNCKPQEDLGIKYFSSSLNKLFKQEQKDYSERFEYQVLQIFNDRISAANYEISLHQKYEVGSNSLFYNKVKQTNTGFDRTGIITSEKTRKKQSEAKIGKETWNKGKIGIYSNETRKKISDAAKKQIQSDESNLKRSKTLQGRFFSEEHRKKISEGNLGKKRTKEQNKANAERTRGKSWYSSKNKTILCFSNDE